MPVELIGRMTERPMSELERPLTGAPALDLGWLKQMFQAQETAGFDRVLIGNSALRPDGWAIAQYGAGLTDRLGFLLAHRPGFIAPTVAARKGATLDHLSNGRLAIHIIAGDDPDLRKDGDFLTKVERYQRTDEFLEVVKLTWTSDAPFDYEGRYYRVEQAYSNLKPLQKPHVPIYFAGSSDEALEVAAKQAHTWAMWSVPLAGVKAQIEAVRARAAKYGRRPGISVSFRPILASTEARAWEGLIRSWSGSGWCGVAHRKRWRGAYIRSSK